MDDVKQQLQILKKENHDLEKELRGALFDNNGQDLINPSLYCREREH